jgi:ribosomal protein L34
MRLPAVLLPILFLAACGRPVEQANATLEDDGRIECRIGADTEYSRHCSVERARTEQGTLLTVRKPDGGFRRLMTTRDGRGVVAADGAEQAQVSIVGEDLIEVGIAGDSFRLPARIGPVSAQRP